MYVELRERLRHEGKTYLALSGLAAKLGDNLNPGRWPGLRYFAPLGLMSILHGRAGAQPKIWVTVSYLLRRENQS